MTETNRHDDARLLRRLIALLATLVLAVPLVWLGCMLYGVRQTEIIGAELQSRGCGVGYASQLTASEALLATALERLGFASRSFAIRSVFANSAPLSDSDLVYVEGLDRLEALDLSGTNVTDAGLDRLAGLPRLDYLNLDGTRITDAGVTHLSMLTELQVLALNGTQVTDAGLVPLEKLTSLIALNLEKTAVTQAGIDRLKKALPQLEITR